MRKKTLFTKLLAGIFFAAFFLIGPAYSQNTLTLSTNYPLPQGTYDKLQLAPRGAAPAEFVCGDSGMGAVYYDTTQKAIMVCMDDVPTAKWIPITSGTSGIWDRDSAGGYIFPTNLNDRLGLGTIAPAFKLTLENDGGILAKGSVVSPLLPASAQGSGTRLVWYPRKYAFRAGGVDANQWDEANIGNGTTGFGFNSLATGSLAVVAGGNANTASHNYSTVGGGELNTASGELSAVGGGRGSSATNNRSAVGGGQDNEAAGQYAIVIGGNDNHAIGDNSVVGGGESNQANNSFSVVAGGRLNQALGDYSYVGGGQNNSALERYSTVLGGLDNRVNSEFATISGGQGNFIESGYKGLIAGGANNRIGSVSFSPGAMILGGQGNTITQDFASIIGGQNNTAADWSTIMGGSDNSGLNTLSVIGGQNMKVDLSVRHNFVWGHSPTPQNINPGVGSLIVFSGNVGVGTLTPVFKLDIAGDLGLNGNLYKAGNPVPYALPDYVFNPGYKLMSLDSLRKFVFTKKHLPGVPSAQKTKKGEIKIFERNRVLLEKVEEAHLYIIQLEERIAKLEELVAQTEK